MSRRVVVRVSFSLFVCALVGLSLMASAHAARWEQPGITVVTTSAETVEGRLQSTSANGLELVVDERAVTIPWRTVVMLSFTRGRP